VTNYGILAKVSISNTCDEQLKRNLDNMEVGGRREGGREVCIRTLCWLQ